MATTVVFDTDIRPGDLVQLVSFDPVWEPDSSGSFGKVGLCSHFNAYGVPPDGRTSFAAVVDGRWVYGLFRVFHRAARVLVRGAVAGAA